MADSWLQFAANSLLCKVSQFPFTYLGLPIGGNASRISTWDPIIDRMSKKLATWKGKLLSIARRLTLIKASLSNLPLYYMSLFPIPKGVIDKIGKLQRQFLWCGYPDKKGFPLVRWDLIELPKIFGGLSVGNLLHRNIALLFKWLWRFLNEPDALWRKIIQAKYNYSPSFTISDLTIPTRGGPWRGICSFII